MVVEKEDESAKRVRKQDVCFIRSKNLNEIVPLYFGVNIMEVDKSFFLPFDPSRVYRPFCLHVERLIWPEASPALQEGRQCHDLRPC